MEQDDIALQTTSAAGPAMFLLATKVGSTPEHDWLQMIKAVYSSLLFILDLKDSLTESPVPYWELYTDRGSFVCSGKHMSGYVVATQSEVIESGALMSHVSEQEPKLVALTRALELSERKKVNICMDSKFAFGIVCILWGNLEGGRFVISTWYVDQICDTNITFTGSSTKTSAIMHCRAHQKKQGQNEKITWPTGCLQRLQEKASILWFHSERLAYQILSQNVVQKIVN